MKDKNNTRWCSKHQRVHKEDTNHISCRFPNNEKYPDTVCQTCGDIGSEGHQFKISTWYEGKCDICNMKTIVTEARDFFYCKNRTIKEIRQLVKRSMKIKTERKIDNRKKERQTCI